MATLYGRSHSRREIESSVGHMRQVAGITLGELSDGRARGIRTAEVRTGSGLSFTVALDRAMDIIRADYRGRSLCWNSVTGPTHAAYYEPEGLGWLRSFGGGLLTTCGLTYFGGPNVDQGEALGLHGRIANTPAENVGVTEAWAGNHYILALRGAMRDGHLFGPCLKLERTIVTELGAKTIGIHDEVTNIGPRPSPLMLLYHCNLGWPVLAPGARLLAPSRTVKPNMPFAAENIKDHAKVTPPKAGTGEQVFEHALAAKRGKTCVALVNDELDGGFGVCLRFDTAQLPVLNEWKLMNESEYVMGLEPGTNGITGRANERKMKRLTMLRPGQTRVFNLEISVLDGAAEVRAIEREINGLRGKRKPQLLSL